MIYVICGPTCCGKTTVALKLANKLNCHIYNADAFQIYKDMNIGTAKVTDIKDKNKHFLLDIVTPDNIYSIKQYKIDFWNKFNEVKEKNIVMCGGSGLYIRSALYDYEFPDFDDDISDLEKMSNEELFILLTKIDKKSSENIHMNNRKRIIHAISLARTGNKKSDIISKQSHSLINKDTVFIFINPNRDELYKNINIRVDKMFEDGLIDEVKNLLKNYNLSTTSKEAIGYKEVISYLNNEINLDECKELIKKRTRNYAKRQVTYFKHQLPCKIYDSAESALKDLL